MVVVVLSVPIWTLPAMVGGGLMVVAVMVTRKAVLVLVSVRADQRERVPLTL